MMKVHVSRVALVAALTWSGFSAANACPTEQHSFRSSDDEISWIGGASVGAGFAAASSIFSHDVEDESISSYIRQFAAAPPSSDIGTYFDTLEQLPSPALLTGLAGTSNREFLLGDEDEVYLEVAEATGSLPALSPPAESALHGYEDR